MVSSMPPSPAAKGSTAAKGRCQIRARLLEIIKAAAQVICPHFRESSDMRNQEEISPDESRDPAQEKVKVAFRKLTMMK